MSNRPEEEREMLREKDMNGTHVRREDGSPGLPPTHSSGDWAFCTAFL